MMKADERRKKIAQTLNAQQPTSATALASQFSVSRQIIVGDIALLRASGLDIIATPRGYKLGQASGLIRTVACAHRGIDKLEQELLVMVDNGCTVIDVVVEHRLYGEITGQLSLSSRYDVGQFVEKVKDASTLSSLTGGIHLHNLRCPSQAAYERVCQQLEALGILYTQNETQE